MRNNRVVFKINKIRERKRNKEIEGRIGGEEGNKKGRGKRDPTTIKRLINALNSAPIRKIKIREEIEEIRRQQ